MSGGAKPGGVGDLDGADRAKGPKSVGVVEDVGESEAEGEEAGPIEVAEDSAGVGEGGDLLDNPELF